MIQNQYIFATLLTSKPYHYFVLIQLVFVGCLTVMTFYQFQKAYVLEGLLISMMASDMFIRMMSDQVGSYSASFSNRLDMAFLLLAILMFAFETVCHPFRITEKIDAFVVVLRYLSQLYRGGRLIMQERDSRMVTNLEPITISFDNESFVDKFH